MVMRWHAHPDTRLRNSGDTIEAHQSRVARLCIEIAARMDHTLIGSDLIRAALYHDEPERILGDMPSPAKMRFPDLAAAYERAEQEVMAELGIAPFDLTKSEQAILHLADKADAWAWGQKCGVNLSDDKRECMKIAWGLHPDAAAWWDSFVHENETP
jgi:hypothetical protein